MLTDPAQESIFQEEEFTDVRYRKELLPLWFRIMTGLGAASWFIFTLGSIAAILRPDGTDNDLEYTMMFVLTGVFATGGIACIQLLQEKKWAIYAVTFAALFQLFIFSATFYMMYVDGDPNLAPVLIAIAIIVVLPLIFLIKILLIFKRWLAYHSSVKLKR